jgi:tRNA (guanine37-N1)-methyltransferase
MKKVWIITLFPEYFRGFLEQGVVSHALRGKRGEPLKIELVSLVEFSPKGHKGIDDAPYGGGPGMILRADVLKNALLEGVVKTGNYGTDFRKKLHIVYPSPRGVRWSQQNCKKFVRNLLQEGEKDLVMICGRYEGIDERFLQLYVDQEISLGDFVLSGGELAAMVILDSAVRCLPGVLGNQESLKSESFQDNLLEYPQYTRPLIFDSLEVPAILRSGHHEKIKAFQAAESIRITQKFRPDLLEGEK